MAGKQFFGGILIGLILASGCGAATVMDNDAQPVTAAESPAQDCANGVCPVVTAQGTVCTFGQSMACAELGGSFADGQATCRTDGNGWDVSACELARVGQFEMVKPAVRVPDRFATARCNDGTPFGFAVRLAPRPSSTWVIYLQGGVLCDDYSIPCSQRLAYEPWLTTTPPAADLAPVKVGLTGVLGTDPVANPDFYDKNQVLAYYCSSDFWSGATTDRRPSSGDPASGWYFSGRANVDAMLSILMERYGLDDSDDALELLWSGGSAGAFGAHFNAAHVLERLPRAAAAKRVKLLVDAGWMTAWDDPANRFGAATSADHDMWKRARAFWAGTFDPTCEAGVRDPSACLVAPTWYPFVAKELPVLIQQCSFDAAFTASHSLTPTDPSAPAWVEQVTASFAQVTWLFSGQSPSYHTIAGSNAGMAKGPPGNTLSDVLHQFWTSGSPERVLF